MMLTYILVTILPFWISFLVFLKFILVKERVVIQSLKDVYIMIRTGQGGDAEEPMELLC